MINPLSPTVPMVLVNVHTHNLSIATFSTNDDRNCPPTLMARVVILKPIPIDHALQTQMVQNIVSHIELLTKQLSLNLFPILPIENLSNTQEIHIDALVLFISLPKFS